MTSVHMNLIEEGKLEFSHEESWHKNWSNLFEHDNFCLCLNERLKCTVLKFEDFNAHF